MNEQPECTRWEVDWYLVLRQWQRDRCGMCGVQERVAGRLVMDHDHMTGLIRGWLCRSCNVTEGRSDHPRWEAWRNGQNPAAILGISEEYIHMIPGAAVLERMAREEALDPDKREAAKQRTHAAVASIPYDPELLADLIAEAVTR